MCAIAQSSAEPQLGRVLSRLRLDRILWCGQLTTRRLRSSLKIPAVDTAGMGLPSLSGLRKWSSNWSNREALSEYFTYQVIHLQRRCNFCQIRLESRLQALPSITQYSTTFLVPQGTAAPCRRREPTVFEATGAGGESDVCHCTELRRAATGRSLSRLRLD